MSIKEERVWAGSSTSHKTALEAEAGYVAKMAADIATGVLAIAGIVSHIITSDKIGLPPKG